MKTIAILTPKIDTFSNPTLILLFEKLIEEKYKILFFGFEQIFIPSEIRSKIEIHTIPFNFFSFFKRPKFYRRPYDVLKLVKQYFTIFKLFRIKNKVKSIICIDPMGLVYGGRIKKLLNVKIIYLSFEIFFKDEFLDNEKVMITDLEKKYSSEADLVIIQDEEREILLRSVNNFRENIKFIHIPVSPKFRIIESKEQSNIHKEFNIPEDKFIVVYSGTLQRWSGINEILDLFPDKWPDNLWLLIHSHFILHENDELKIRIKKHIEDKQNITFHNKPFYDFADYTKFLSGCYIGIAVYFPNKLDFFAGKNIMEIGLSSGKFSTYMMLGKPTITTSNRIYKILNEKYNFGYTINSVSEIPEGLNEIKNNYKEKAEGCKLLFDEVLDPESKIDILMENINDFTK